MPKVGILFERQYLTTSFRMMMLLQKLLVVFIFVLSVVTEAATDSAHQETVEVSIDGTIGGHEVIGLFDRDPYELDGEALLRIIHVSESELQGNTYASVNSALEHVSSLVEQAERLKSLSAAVEEHRQAVDELIRLANSRQLEHLIDRLNRTLEQELKLRSSDQRHEDLAAEGASYETVPLNVLKRTFEIKNILEESENELRQWVMEIIKEELAAYERTALSNGVVSGSNSNCATPADVVQTVQSALMKFSQDGIGIVDHAQGGSIVHDLTSQSFVPLPTQTDLVGNVWWSKYIPEDWERVLPPGWQDWNSAIPSYIYHFFGVRGAKTAPPESVLDGNTHPGACWPMDGSTGQITIRLPYPVKIGAITVDHVSSLLVSEGSRDSAPKRIRVVGYPSCDDDDRCTGIGFDSRDAIRIGELEYDAEGPSVQTFDFNLDMPPSIGTNAEESEFHGAVDEDDPDDDDESGSASCSISSSSCSTPPQHVVAGVTFQILDNWGNPDFTCLYRFRIHGDRSIK